MKLSWCSIGFHEYTDWIPYTLDENENDDLSADAYIPTQERMYRKCLHCPKVQDIIIHDYNRVETKT